MDGLDREYLLTEVIDEPLFMDDKILHEVLRVTDRSMADNVNRYRMSQDEYRNYIEMWVHEIKAPLATSKLIISNSPSRVALSLQGGTEEIEDFVEQTLFYIYSMGPKKDYIIKKLSLQEYISKVVHKHSKSFTYQGVKIQLDDLGLSVYSDGKWLEFILDRIISNALKCTPKEVRTTHIWTISTDNMVSPHIQGNGSGISSSGLDRIFEERLARTNGRLNEKATGMGLCLCRILCNKLCLETRAESVQGQGTTIIPGFPISKLMLLK